MGFLKCLATTFVYVTSLFGVITFVPGLPPNSDFTEYRIKPPAALEGVYERNDRLNGAELLFQGNIKGPEYFDSYNGELYTSTLGGWVAKITDNKIVPIVKFGKDCAGLWEEEKCGRPLGLKFDARGQLYVVDTYYGIFKVDPRTAKYEKIVDLSVAVDGKVPMLPNSIDVAKNGDIYWTDSSTEFKLQDGLFTMFTNPSGRLIRYNAATKKNEVLMKDLGFANGVKLSDDESHVIVTETMKSTIVKYHLRGSKAGQSELLIEGLPGMPDNVHSDGFGNYLVSIIVPADPDRPQLTQTLTPHPYIRKMLARFLGVIELPFKLLDDVYPNEIAKRAIYTLGSFSSVSFMRPLGTIVLRIDATGKILDVLHNTDETIGSISSAFLHGDYLWLGSPDNDYVARVPIDKAFPNGPFSPRVKINENVARGSAANVEKPAGTTTPKTTTATTPRPTTTTTTPRPTTTTTPRPTTTTTTPRPTTTTTTPRPTTTTPRPTTTTTQKPITAPPTQVPEQEKPRFEQAQQAKPRVEQAQQTHRHFEEQRQRDIPSERFDKTDLPPPRQIPSREETDELPRPIQQTPSGLPSGQPRNFEQREIPRQPDALNSGRRINDEM